MCNVQQYSSQCRTTSCTTRAPGECVYYETHRAKVTQSTATHACDTTHMERCYLVIWATAAFCVACIFMWLPHGHLYSPPQPSAQPAALGGAPSLCHGKARVEPRQRRPPRCAQAPWEGVPSSSSSRRTNERAGAVPRAAMHVGAHEPPTSPGDCLVGGVGHTKLRAVRGHFVGVGSACAYWRHGHPPAKLLEGSHKNSVPELIASRQDADVADRHAHSRCV